MIVRGAFCDTFSTESRKFLNIRLKVLVQFPDAESRQAAFLLLGANAPLGVEGWNGRHVALAESVLSQLESVGIQFMVVERIEVEERAEDLLSVPDVAPRSERSTAPFIHPAEWTVASDATIRRFDSNGVDLVHQTARNWRVDLSRAEWELARAMNAPGCFLALRERELFGVITTISYLNSVAWIGELHVDPRERLGRTEIALLDEALRHLKEAGCVEALIDEASISLFERRGFEVVGKVNRWRIRRNTSGGAHPCVRGFRKADIARVIALDQQATGLLRGRGLFDLPGAGEDLPLIYERPHSRLGGFGCIRRGESADRIGPVVARDEMAARLLVSTLLLRLRNRTVWWEIPKSNATANALAQEMGFHRSETAMEVRRGKRIPPRKPEFIFATGGRLLG